MVPLVGCSCVGENGFQFSTMVPFAPLKMVIELFAALGFASPSELEQPASTSVTAAAAATVFFIGGFLVPRQGSTSMSLIIKRLKFAMSSTDSHRRSSAACP